MLKTILVPIDFSPTSLNAAHYAQKFARQAGAKLILIHAYEQLVPLPIVEGLLYSNEELREVMKDKLKNLGQELEKVEPLIKIESMLIDGSLISVMKELADAMDVFMVIMGITGAGKLKETFIGSNTMLVSKSIKAPVLIVPNNALYAKVNDVGLTTDFRDVAETIPDKKIIDLVMNIGARLHVLHINLTNQKQLTEKPFQSGIVETMFERFHPTYHFIEDTNSADGLNNYALANSIEILIAVPKKHNLIHQLFLGSKTKELAFHSTIPVLVMHE
jgi:nucleotide-binding universal stress UspA family protein